MKKGDLRLKVSFTSAIFAIAFISLLIYSYNFFRTTIEDATEATIRASTEASHSDMAALVSNTLSSEIRKIILDYNKSKAQKASNSNEFLDFDSVVRDIFVNSSVVKLKIYAEDGIAIYSTNPNDLGEIESDLEYLIHALRGRSSSEFEERASFEGISGSLQNVDIVSSYHPFTDDQGAVIGVVEIYSNRTPEFIKSRLMGQAQIGKYLIILALFLSAWLIYTVIMISQSRKRY